MKRNHDFKVTWNLLSLGEKEFKYIFKILFFFFKETKKRPIDTDFALETAHMGEAREMSIVYIYLLTYCAARTGVPTSGI